MNTTFRLIRATFLGILLGLTIASGSLAYECDLFRTVANVDVDSDSAVIDGMILENGCWRGEAPADMAGKFPGHVVVTKDGMPRVGGAPMVSKALAQVFDGADHGLTVHAFCR